MPQARSILQLVRIPVIVGLLVATSLPLGPFVQAFADLRMEDAWSSWLAMIILSLACATLFISGRRQRHPTTVLVIEALVAGTLAFVPPLQWIVWFGYTDIVAGTGALAAPLGFMQPLSVAWFIVVATTALSQVRANLGSA